MMQKYFFLLTLAFIFVVTFLGASYAQPAVDLPFKGDTAGIVNRHAILRRDYAEQFDQVSKEMIKDKARPLLDQEVLEAHRKTWDQLILTTAIEDSMEERRITISDAEIDTVLQNNPPEFLKRNFIDSLGVFNKVEFLLALKDPQNDTIVRNLKKEMRKELRKQKFADILSASIPKVTDEELWDDFKTKKGATRKAFDKQKDKLREEATTSRHQIFFGKWIEAIRANAMVIDYRTSK